MKNLIAKLRRKLGVSSQTPTHPDLNPPSDWAVPPAEYLPGTSLTGVGSEPDEPLVAPAEAIEDNLHPDLHVIDPRFFVEDIPDDRRVSATIQTNAPVSGNQPSTAKVSTYLEAENESPAAQEMNSGCAMASATPDVLTLVDQLETKDADDGYDKLSDEEDDLPEQDDDIWETAFSYAINTEAEGIRPGEDLLDTADFSDFLEFDPQEIENETENAQWEDLLDLDPYEEGPDLPDEEPITDSGQLDDYAARLVNQMRSIKLDERSRLHGRSKAILEEFPFSASYRALLSLVNDGNSLEELEDACELKCLWREAPWLWSRRRFNKMQRAWQTEVRTTYRNALSWKLAMELISRVGRVEAERRIFDDWLDEWLQMQPDQSSDGMSIDPRFWSYPAFLKFNHERIELADNDSWYYEEPIDTQPSSSFRLRDSDGQFWTFEPKDGRGDTSFLSILPHSKRMAEQHEAKAREESKVKEAQKDA